MLSLLALCLPAAAQTAQPDVTLEFKGTTGTTDSSTPVTESSFKNNMSSGVDFVEGITVDKCFLAANSYGLKFGNKSTAGYVTITVSSPYQKEVEKIVVNAASYGSDNSSIKVNSLTTKDTNGSGSNFKDLTFTGFSGKLTTLKIETTSKRGYVKSIAIYFKPDKEPVEQPVIKCTDNKVTISCGTEEASIVYTLDGGETWLPYDGEFPITESCTVKAKATKDGMADSEVVEQECAFVPTTKPDGAVVMIGDQVAEDCETYEVAYGTEISISAKNATGLVVKNSVDNVEEEKENPYTFKAEKSADYDVTPYNDIDYAETFMFHLDIVAPEITLVKNGETGIADGSTVTVKKGTEILVEAFSASEVKVANASGDVAFADGKFAVSDEGEYTITAINPEYADGVNFKFIVAYPEAPEYDETALEMTWEITGVDNGSTKTQKCDTDLTSTSEIAGVWHATSAEDKCFSSKDNGAHLGSGDTTFKGGTVTLTGSDIPADAIIKSVSVSGKAASSATMVWSLKVNGQAAANTITFDNTSVTTKTIDEVNLEGNEIVLTLSEATDKKAVWITGISVTYLAPAEPSAPEFDVPATIEHGSTIVYTVKYGKIHYHIEEAGAAKSPMMRVSEPTADWTVATENEGKQFTYEYVAGNNHNIYVKNVVNGKEVEGEAINVNASGTVTGVEAVAAEGAEGVRELYNLQGVRVSEAEAVPGVYVERRGGKVAKVVIR